MLDKFADFRSDSSQPAGTFAALDVVEVDEQYKKLAQYLLSNVYIAENEEAINNSNGAIVLEKRANL